MAIRRQFNSVRTKAEALLLLGQAVSARSYPSLSVGELTVILDRHQRAAVWGAGETYCVGDRVQVMQTVQNAPWWPADVAPSGVYWRCLSGGVAGEAEPSWFGTVALVSPVYGLADGGVVWRYDGLALPDLWDMGAATRDGWLEKAARVAAKYDVSSAQQSMKRSQMYDHCIRQANRYAPLFLV